MNKFDTLYQQIILEYAETCQIDYEVPYKDYLIKVTCISNQTEKEYIYEISKNGKIIHQSNPDIPYISYNQALSFAKSVIENLSNRIPNPSKKYAKLIGPKGKNIFESESVTDVELFGNEVVNSILKIYKFSNGNFNDIDTEIVNFKFVEPINDRLTEIDDYKVDETTVSEELDLRKIIVFDKNTNKILFDEIFYANDIPRILCLIDYVKLKEAADIESEHNEKMSKLRYIFN